MGTDTPLRGMDDSDVARIEQQMPKSVSEANADLLRRTQGGKVPTWVIVYRRRGAIHFVLRDLEAPYRKGEPALVKVTESVVMADKTVACWAIHYHDKISGDYPQDVELPIEEYVWKLYDADVIGTKYCLRPRKTRRWLNKTE
jgi:hypothetical protein